MTGIVTKTRNSGPRNLDVKAVTWMYPRVVIALAAQQNVIAKVIGLRSDNNGENHHDDKADF